MKSMGLQGVAHVAGGADGDIQELQEACGEMVFFRQVKMGICKNYRGLVGHESALSGFCVEEAVNYFWMD